MRNNFSWIKQTPRQWSKVGKKTLAPVAMAALVAGLPAGKVASQPQPKDTFKIRIEINDKPRQRRPRYDDWENRDGHSTPWPDRQDCDLFSWQHPNARSYVNTQSDCLGIHNPNNLHDALINHKQYNEIDYCNRYDGRNCPSPNRLQQIWYRIKDTIYNY
jgi:hypothetical protein